MKNFDTSVDYTKLKTTLVNSKLPKDNNPLYYTIKRLIEGAQSFSDQLSKTISTDDKIDLSSQVSGFLSPDNGGVLTGSYFPALINLANVTASNVYYTLFAIESRQVRVDGKLNIQPTAGGVLTQLELQ